jgi:hypothetical protein
VVSLYRTGLLITLAALGPTLIQQMATPRNVQEFVDVHFSHIGHVSRFPARWETFPSNPRVSLRQIS